MATTLVLDIATPLGVYFSLVAAGMSRVWALLCAAATSVVVLALRWAQSRSVSALGALVLVRFALGVVVALVTGDARFVLVKDSMVTFAIAVFAAVSLSFERPLIARIRRDLSPDRGEFDSKWRASAAFRDEHRLLTRLWVAGLVTEVATAMMVISMAPLDIAVVVMNIFSPLVIVSLVAVTQIRGRRVERGSATNQ